MPRRRSISGETEEGKEQVSAGLARPARSRLDEQPPPLPTRRQAPSLSDLLAEARQAER